MKTITIRQLHDKTGYWLREANRQGEIVVTNRGAAIAKIVPGVEETESPYFAQRKLLPGFRKLWESGELNTDSDSTMGISEDRDARD